MNLGRHFRQFRERLFQPALAHIAPWTHGVRNDIDPERSPWLGAYRLLAIRDLGHMPCSQAPFCRILAHIRAILKKSLKLAALQLAIRGARQGFSENVGLRPLIGGEALTREAVEGARFRESRPARHDEGGYDRHALLDRDFGRSRLG